MSESFSDMTPSVAIPSPILSLRAPTLRLDSPVFSVAVVFVSWIHFIFRIVSGS